MISSLFHLLLFILPFIFFPKSSELFELNKITTVYGFTIVLVALFVVYSIDRKKIVFRRTTLDKPILLFLGTLSLATLFSIDPRTSILGYYSRFHGGLLSFIAYCLLYFVYVNFMGKKSTFTAIRLILLAGVFVSLYAIFEHFGKSPSCLLIRGEFDVSCWVQDVQHRVFATFGQPNWLASWLTAIIPLSWATLTWNAKNKRGNILLYLAFFILYSALLFTKSRSGLIGFGVSFLVFWGFILFNNRKRLRTVGVRFAQSFVLTFLISILWGTPWSPSLQSIVNPVQKEVVQISTGENQIEVGGTESGEIRKIVWQGALDVWRHNVLLGTGVETFAFSYYQFRPMAHNTVSEWNFIYNKAHNEYLNFAATTGTVGFVSYTILVIASIYQIYKTESLKPKQPLYSKAQSLLNKPGLLKNFRLRAALLAGYASILVTNFFGFSVVVTGLYMFLFPAMAVSLSRKEEMKYLPNTPLVGKPQKMGVLLTLTVASFALLTLARFWYADYLYAQGRANNRGDNLYAASVYLSRAIRLSPHEPIYYDELADIMAHRALGADTEGESLRAEELAVQASELSETAIRLSPRNVKLLKSSVNIYSNLGQIDENYFTSALEILGNLSVLAPTDPSVPYLMSLSLANGGSTERSIEFAEKAVQMKPNYKSARVFLAYLYKQEARVEDAKEQLLYVLEYISPDDENIIHELELLKTQD